MRDVHGMTIGVATDPTLDGRDSMLAVAMNGQVLPQAHGYPVRVVIPGLYGYVSATKWVVDMEFTTFGAFSAYWVKQTPAWSQQAPIKTESRIDVPKRRSTVAAGQMTIAGVAWARSSLSTTFGNIPAVDLIAILVGLPVVAAAGGWLLAGRQPPAIARQPLE